MSDDDQKLLQDLKRQVDSVIDDESQDEGGIRFSVCRSFYAAATAKKVLEVLERDGLALHPLFKPVAEAMTKVPVGMLNDNKTVARALVEVLTPADDHPWKKILAQPAP